MRKSQDVPLSCSGMNESNDSFDSSQQLSNLRAPLLLGTSGFLAPFSVRHSELSGLRRVEINHITSVLIALSKATVTKIKSSGDDLWLVSAVFSAVELKHYGGFEVCASCRRRAVHAMQESVTLFRKELCLSLRMETQRQSSFRCVANRFLHEAIESALLCTTPIETDPRPRHSACSANSKNMFLLLRGKRGRSMRSIIHSLHTALRTLLRFFHTNNSNDFTSPVERQWHLSCHTITRQGNLLLSSESGQQPVYITQGWLMRRLLVKIRGVADYRIP